MFRGPTRGKVIQTMDLGSGKGEYIERQSKKFPKRTYSAVDALYKGFFSAEAHRLRHRGVFVGDNIENALIEMVRSGWRARHLNMDMPYPWDSPEYRKPGEKTFRRVMELIPKVLLPNGKFYIASENHYTIQEMMTIARQHGFSVRETKPLKPLLSPLADAETILSNRRQKPHYYRTKVMNSFANFPIYRLEITYNLRKAIPDKNMRRQLAAKPPKKVA